MTRKSKNIEIVLIQSNYILICQHFCYIRPLFAKPIRNINEQLNCVYGYLAACTQPKWPNQVGSLDFGGQSTVPPLVLL